MGLSHGRCPCTARCLHRRSHSRLQAASSWTSTCRHAQSLRDQSSPIIHNKNKLSTTSLQGGWCGGETVRGVYTQRVAVSQGTAPMLPPPVASTASWSDRHFPAAATTKSLSETSMGEESTQLTDFSWRSSKLRKNKLPFSRRLQENNSCGVGACVDTPAVLDYRRGVRCCRIQSSLSESALGIKLEDGLDVGGLATDMCPGALACLCAYRQPAETSGAPPLSRCSLLAPPP